MGRWQTRGHLLKSRAKVALALATRPPSEGGIVSRNYPFLAILGSIALIPSPGCGDSGTDGTSQADGGESVAADAHGESVAADAHVDPLTYDVMDGGDNHMVNDAFTARSCTSAPDAG